MQKTVITLVSDLSGADADATVPFVLDGAHYEIDLTTPEADALRDALEPFIANARRTGGRRRRGGGTAAAR